jgi:hypothetical protein
MSNCIRCGDDEVGLVKRAEGWICDECEAWEREADSLDTEGYLQRRLERLTEAQEH